MLIPLLTSNSVNFENLAIFICHLVIGGKFQIAQFLHNPGVVDDHLLKEIHRNCPITIPWLTVDITQPMTPTFSTIQYRHFIQIIFPGSDLEFEIKQLTINHPNYYRLIIFQSNIDGHFKPILSRNHISDPIKNTIALMHNSTSDSFRAISMHDNFTILHDWIELINKSETSKELFHNVFGKRERMRVFGINDQFTACISTYKRIWKDEIYFEFVKTFFFTQMNMSFIKSTNCMNKTIYYRHILKPIYNELSEENETILV